MWDEKRLKIAARKLAEQEMDKAGKGYPDEGLISVSILLRIFWNEAMRRAYQLRKEVSA